MDFLNYIEIHAVSEKGIPIHVEVHTLIHECILNGILSACNFLHHEDTKLDLAFLCPHAQSNNERKCHCSKSCGEVIHPALVLSDHETMRCLYEGKYYRLLDQHKVWLSKSADGLNACIPMCMLCLKAIRVIVMPFKLTVCDITTSEKIEKLIDTLANNGVTSIAAAGNDGLNENPHYPALYKNVLSVGSVDK